MRHIINAGTIVLILFVWWCIFAGGPVRTYRYFRGCSRAKEGSQRRELVKRVQTLLPQATEETVLFSMQEVHSYKGGSQMTIKVSDYIPSVFVVDGDKLWFIPMEVGKRHSYRLGTPVAITGRSIQNVSLTGKPGKREEYTFEVETQSGTVPVTMVAQSFLYRKNRHCPLDLMQVNACEQAVLLAQRFALVSCDISAHDLEEECRKDRALRYAAYAGSLGFMGLMCTPGGDIRPVAAFFVAAVGMFGLMLRNRRIPKVSALIVLAEAFIAYQFMK